jgi:transcriptional regulator with XRE-family HTH domain
VDQRRPWATRVTKDLGARVAFYRERRKLSAQDLADRCAGLGMPSLSRVVITKLENGRREAVSTAELQVLAKALDVPPVLLLFPVGFQEAAEVLPAVMSDPWHALRWFEGHSGDPGDPAAEPSPESRVLWYWRENDRYAAIVRDAHERLRWAVDSAEASHTAFEATSAEAEHRRELAKAEGRHLSTAVTALRNLRETIAQAGMLLPPLSPDVASILDDWHPAPGGLDPYDDRPGNAAADPYALTDPSARTEHQEADDGPR